MSDTPTDMAKVTQMLDAGWYVGVEKNDLGSYSASASHINLEVAKRARDRFLSIVSPTFVRIAAADFEPLGHVTTDDFTPERALTRLAYKVHGEII